MLRKRADVRKNPSDRGEHRTDAGALQALEQVANWVRFSDTKATVLTAGFGVVVTVLLSNWKIVLTAISRGDITAGALLCVASAALISGLLTLYWLVLAITPRSAAADPGLNRFSWPALARTTAAELAQHAADVPVSDDAWRQAIRLAAIADRKFRYTGYAVWSFAAFVVLGFVTVTVAVTVGG